MFSLPVKPELGPSLPQLAAPRWRRAPRVLRAVVVVLGALVVLVVAFRVLGGGTAAETSVVIRGAQPFNLRYPDALRRVAPRSGALLALQARRGDLFLQSFAVEPLTLAPYRGLSIGTLPVAAEGLKARLRRRFADFELVEEGRTRINEVPGYEVVFTARSAERRRLYGRWVMLVPVTDPPTPQRRGVTLELLATPASGVPNAEAVGDQGQLKLPLRSFRFGTEAP